MSLRSIVAAALAASVSVAHAQVLPAVTVTVTRSEADPFDVPAAVDVIDGERLRSAGRAGLSLSESLAAVPGIAARDRQNHAQDLQLSIRGFGARSTFGVRGVRLYVDGIPATMPDGQGQVSHFDLASAGRIEVLRGPFSALYGNSSGGVVQLFTEKGEGPPVVAASLAAGSDGLVRPALRASGGVGSFGYHVSANRFETDGTRAHSAAQRDVAGMRLDWRQREGSDWMLAANTMDVEADDPLGLTRADFERDPRSVDPAALAFNTRKTVRQSQVGLVHEHTVAPGQQLCAMVYGGERATVQYQSIPVAAQGNPLHPGGVIGLSRGYGGLDLRWTAREGPFEFTLGVAHDSLHEDRRGWQNFAGPQLGVQGQLRRDEANAVRSTDPYAQATWKPTPRLSLMAGVRRSDVRFASDDRYIAGANGDDSGSLRYAATLPVAAALYAVSPRVRVYAAWGRGFETPTFNELAYRPDGTPGLNLGLRPSRSRNAEIGLKGRQDIGEAWRADWSVAAFDTATQDEIVTQTSSGGRSTFRNAGATKRRGVEASLALRDDSGWTAQLAHTALDARYAEGFATCAATPCLVPTLAIPAGNRIPGTSRSFSAVEIAWQPVRGWRGGMELRHSGQVLVNDANTGAAPAWTTLALHAGYRWRTPLWDVEAAARIDNATDERYAGSVIVNEGNGRFYESAPGRQWSVKLTVTRRL